MTDSSLSITHIGPYRLGPNDDESCGIYTGDSRVLCREIPDESIDLVCCDPPYSKEYLPLYSWLGREAARILEPDGFLLAYAGIYWKTQVFLALSEHLEYFYDFVLLNTGNSPIHWHRKIISRYKSILAYNKGCSKPHTNVLSLWRGGGKDKRYHTWGQDESSCRYYMDCFSKPGDIVIDFFCGGGTTPAVCKVLGRRYLAFEIDPGVAEIARERVRNTQMPLFVLEPEQEKMMLNISGEMR